MCVQDALGVLAAMLDSFKNHAAKLKLKLNLIFCEIICWCTGNPNNVGYQCSVSQPHHGDSIFNIQGEPVSVQVVLSAQVRIMPVEILCTRT